MENENENESEGEIIWKFIPNFNNYEASSLGTIRNTKTKKILKAEPRKTGYIFHQLSINGIKIKKSAHFFVCTAFYGKAPINKTTIDHINRDRSDNRSENLRWANLSEQNNNKEKPKERAGYPVWQICPKTGQKLKRFDNTSRASESIDGNGSIARSIKNHYICGGYYWEFEKIEEIEGEKWIKISKNNKEFYISNYGRVKRQYHSIYRLENLNYRRDGYVVYICNKKEFMVHILVAETFIDNPDKLLIINHIDNNKHNNKIDNLEWITHSDNMKHSWKNKKSAR